MSLTADNKYPRCNLHTLTQIKMPVCKLQREYLLSAVNDLTNSLKITYQTNKDFFQFNISQIHEKIR